MSREQNLTALLPHRPPLLLLEEAEATEERALVAYQTIPQDDLFLRAHFPGFPLWPGTLLTEAMAQTTAIYLLHERGGLAGDEVPVLGAVDCRFLLPVFPGERIRYRAELIRRIGSLGLFAITATRGTELVARGRISAGLTQRSRLAGPAAAKTSD